MEIIMADIEPAPLPDEITVPMGGVWAGLTLHYAGLKTVLHDTHTAHVVVSLEPVDLGVRVRFGEAATLRDGRHSAVKDALRVIDNRLDAADIEMAAAREKLKRLSINHSALHHARTMLRAQARSL
jgi:hypothetical protein